MRARIWLGWIAVALGVMLLGFGCGADNLEAPRTPRSPAERSCKSFEELMPNFVQAIDTGQTEGLREVFQNDLLVSPRPGVPPPANDVLRALFGILAGYAKLPHEQGAAPGEFCSATPPPVDQSNPLCEMRRSMDLMIHSSQGVATLRTLDPLVAGLMDYMNGLPPSSTVTHYEASQVISNMCKETEACQTSDALDFVIGFADFAQTADGKKTIADLTTLLNNPALAPYLSDNAQTYGGEQGVDALVDVLINTIEGMTDPSALDNLPVQDFPADLRPDIQAVIDDTKIMLDPNRTPNILAPLKRSMYCIQQSDPNHELVNMLFRLGLEQHLPAFGIHNLMNLVQQLLNADPRGTLLHLTETLAKSLRQDAQAQDSLGKVCETLFSNQVSAGETKSNAQLALPVVGNLFREGVVEEGVCAADTLLYGCAGGEQPACMPPQ